MPLTPKDRKFLACIERLKVYLLVLAGGVLLHLWLVPNEMHPTTTVMGLVLCGVFWVTQRLLSYISLLDWEMTRVLNVLKRTLTPEQRRELFPKETEMGT